MSLELLQSTKPTERLILDALRESAVPMTLSEISAFTYSSVASLSDAAQRLVQRGLLYRRRNGKSSYF